MACSSSIPHQNQYQGGERRLLRNLVQADGDVALDPGSEVHLSLDVKLDAEEQGRVLLDAVVVDRALQELPWKKKKEEKKICQ